MADEELRDQSYIREKMGEWLTQERMLGEKGARTLDDLIHWRLEEISAELEILAAAFCYARSED